MFVFLGFLFDVRTNVLIMEIQKKGGKAMPRKPGITDEYIISLYKSEIPHKQMTKRPDYLVEQFIRFKKNGTPIKHLSKLLN